MKGSHPRDYRSRTMACPVRPYQDVSVPSLARLQFCASSSLLSCVQVPHTWSLWLRPGRGSEHVSSVTWT
uniref:Macaca fascicularis brain cDNA clone: QflA-19094, similar to human KIAA1110 protein (KIAA1110), mRNA, RefSeq: XM_370667.2 n=1 Tax=Macaca fascicularis TaxID=9541 RepID=I7GMZ4_MACFA|nr:unnamed protein product [Macaca fascicularis]